MHPTEPGWDRKFKRLRTNNVLFEIRAICVSICTGKG